MGGWPACLLVQLLVGTVCILISLLFYRMCAEWPRLLCVQRPSPSGHSVQYLIKKVRALAGGEPNMRGPAVQGPLGRGGHSPGDHGRGGVSVSGSLGTGCLGGDPRGPAQPLSAPAPPLPMLRLRFNAQTDPWVPAPLRPPGCVGGVKSSPPPRQAADPLTSVLRPRGRRWSLAPRGEAVPGARPSWAPADQRGRGRRLGAPARPGLGARGGAPSRTPQPAGPRAPGCPRGAPHDSADTPAHSRQRHRRRHRPRRHLGPDPGRPAHIAARRRRKWACPSPPRPLGNVVPPGLQRPPAECRLTGSGRSKGV